MAGSRNSDDHSLAAQRRESLHASEDRLPQAEVARHTLAADVEADGQALMDASDAASADGWLDKRPAVQTLRRILEQH